MPFPAIFPRLAYFFSVTVLFGGLACPTDNDDSNNENGFTACGDETCQPGQHCSDPALSFCTNGCTSDLNCTADSRCEDIDDFDGIGTCAETGGEGEGEGEGEPNEDPLEACQAACDHFQACGLAAAEAASCRTDCVGLNTAQQTAVGNCEATSCSEAPGCLGIDCFSDGDCADGEECVGSACL